MDDIRALKGDLIFSKSAEEMEFHEQSYIVLRNGTVEGTYKELPEKYRGIPVTEYGHNIIIPGFADLHLHAPQFYQRGLGMDMQLLEWLEKYTFRNESRFSDTAYAEKVYSHFTDELVAQGTLCASVFATVHKEASDILFQIMLKKGNCAYVGKVNMDRNCRDTLKEDTNLSLFETEEIILKYQGNSLVKPIITPRFVPTCSSQLMKGLGKLAVKYNIPVQSHLSENREEVSWVKKLHPEFQNYSEVYHDAGLFGQTATLMAHCVYLTEEEIQLMAENKVIAVHCPHSNLNLGSGIMPIRKLLRQGISLGLGSDVGGGHNLSIPKVMVSAIQQSKMMKLIDSKYEPITFEETFYMATKGGGSFFGKTGSFENGYRFDALIIDDDGLGKEELQLEERLQRFIYIGDDRNIVARFVQGNKIG